MPHPSTRRHALLRSVAVATLAGIGALAQGEARAQDYPLKPISIVVPFPPGGTTDLVARPWPSRWRRASASRCWSRTGRAPARRSAPTTSRRRKPDGYTLLMGAVHHTIAPSVYKKLSYDLQKDLAPITTVASVPNIVAVNPAVTPVKTIAELIALAKASAKTQLSYGSNGNGTAQHLIGTLFQQQTGTTLLHVPYKGSAPLVADLLGGQVNMSFDSITAQWSFLKNGKLLPLAVTAPRARRSCPTCRRSRKRA